MSVYTREELGDFTSVACTKAMTTGLEKALGEKATRISLTVAGKQTGKELAAELGLVGSTSSLEDAAQKIASALGPEGSRLLILDRLEESDGVIRAYTRETICSAGEEAGSDRNCTFTLGAVWGALESILGKKLRGKHTESVLRGGTHDVFEFSVLRDLR